MPIREYICNNCDNTNDHLMSMSIDPPLTLPCKVCGSTSFYKRFSTSSFMLMGEGWDRPSKLNRVYKPNGGIPDYGDT